jgi:diguanylate cyclase (GGDEF)-like protein
MIALAMTMREGRITFANPAFMRCSNHPTRWLVRMAHPLIWSFAWGPPQQTERPPLSARQEVAPFALLMADLDGFKLVNDTYGHDAGDAALRLVGQRLQGCVRDSDTLARPGGDQFAVLLPQVRYSEGAALVAQRLIAAMMQPFELGSQAVSIGISIGLPRGRNMLERPMPCCWTGDAAMYWCQALRQKPLRVGPRVERIPETATLQPET